MLVDMVRSFLLGANGANVGAGSSTLCLRVGRLILLLLLWNAADRLASPSEECSEVAWMERCVLEEHSRMTARFFNSAARRRLINYERCSCT